MRGCHVSLSPLAGMHGAGPMLLSDITRASQEEGQSFTKPPLLQESRLTGGGSPYLVDLVEWKDPVEWKL